MTETSVYIVSEKKVEVWKTIMRKKKSELRNLDLIAAICEFSTYALIGLMFKNVKVIWTDNDLILLQRLG